ncbi:hypothetical protein [Phytohabitans suffuscus]|uniref:Uncharacterized protein n=1 Tax=Phytohabitans suffuscus TaxID=624315 RepID=A0A6F8YI19_9ACTN|nr:hypothetical protein [Phytohabitans suffuscus]BCB85608.1 hypothetical protein Psuf_029210 [Phytohabitans suffuscus]
MDGGVDRTGGRLSLAVISAGAALVLAAGTAWWVAAAPDLDAYPAATPPAVVAPDPVVPEQVDNGSASYLPDFPNTIQRQVGRLDPDMTHVMSIPSVKQAEYLLQYVCLGSGYLSLRVQGTTDGELLHHVNCENILSALQFRARGTEVQIEVHRPGPEPADVGVQVIDVG